MPELIRNYIYLHHTDEYLILPQYPDTIPDNMSSTFAQQNALARTAPVFAFSNAGPRTVQVKLELHRDMLNDVNINASNFNVEGLGKDYIDTLIKKLQAIALPKFVAESKLVKPPMVSVSFGQEVSIKGVVIGGVSIVYRKPILSNDKYAVVDINFTVYETTPYDAESVSKLGSFRGITSRVADGLMKHGSAAREPISNVNSPNINFARE